MGTSDAYSVRPLGIDPDAVLSAIVDVADQAGMGLVITFSDQMELEEIFINQGMATLMKRTVAELKAQSIWDRIAPEDVEQVKRAHAERLRGGPTRSVFHMRLLRGDGVRIPTEVVTSRVALGGRDANVTFVIDLSTRQQAQDALARSEARFRSLIENAPDGVVILQAGRVAFANAAAARLMGFAEPALAIGAPLDRFLDPADLAVAQARIAELVATGRPHPEPATYRTRGTPEGRDTYVEIRSLLIEYEGRPAVLAFARDVTDRASLSASLARTDRLAAVGTLAAGIAHEINNPLTFILLNLQYAARELPRLAQSPQRLEAVHKRLTEAARGAERVADIVRDLRAVARADEDVRGPVNLVAAVEAALKLVHHELKHAARVVKEFPEGTVIVDGHEGRMVQVFMNLLVNAAQAIEAPDPKRHRVTISIRRLDGGKVEAVVADTGPGIPREIRERVFDPFFTTKPVGVGTGLGLAICHAIVTSLGGELSIDCPPSGGTRARVLLSERAPPPAPPPSDVELPAQAAESATEARARVLLIVADAQVADALRLILADDNDVSTAATAALAVDAIAQAAGGFDAIVCDLALPDAPAPELHGQLATRWPALAARTIYLTGGAPAPATLDFLARSGAASMQKPLDMDGVRAMVRRIARRAR